jgi:hypothetical protein
MILPMVRHEALFDNIRTEMKEKGGRRTTE